MGLFANAFKIGAGVMTAQILFLAIGLIFLVIGMNMLSNARKEGKSLTSAYLVMGVGVVLGLGLGAGMFLENVGNNLNRF
jgi:hypothetical protein